MVLIRPIVIPLAGLCLVAAIGIAILYLLQDRLIYHPVRYAPDSESRFHRPIVRLPFSTSYGAASAFYVPPLGAGDAPPAHLWILFDGNADSALGYDDWLRHFDKSPDGFLLIDYPGYGYNEVSPSGPSIAHTAAGAVHALAMRLGLDERQLLRRSGVFGVSLGAAAALDFTVDNPDVAGLVMAAGYTSIRDMARRMVGWPLCDLARKYLNNQANLAILAKRSPRPPVFLFHGSQDMLIPVTMGRRLAADNPWVKFTEVPDANHNDVIYQALPSIAAAMRQVDDATARLENAALPPDTLSP